MQTTCAKAIVIPLLPYNANNLTTAFRPNSIYPEVCLGDESILCCCIFKLTPQAENLISITVTAGDAFPALFIYNECPLTSCFAYEESQNNETESNLSFVIYPGIDYYIYVGIDELDDFNIEIEKEKIEGGTY